MSIKTVSSLSEALLSVDNGPVFCVGANTISDVSIGVPKIRNTQSHVVHGVCKYVDLNALSTFLHKNINKVFAIFPKILVCCNVDQTCLWL